MLQLFQVSDLRKSKYKPQCGTTLREYADLLSSEKTEFCKQAVL